MENKLEPSKTYQLNVTILEARHLDITNVNTLVVVSVDKQKKELRAKTKKTEKPYFNELFRFKFYEPLHAFIQHRLRISVKRTTCSKLIGQCDIELATVWTQPGHKFFHKWAVLIDPKDPLSGIKGYLKCDIQILAEGLPQLIPDNNEAQEIEGNLLVPSGALHRRQNALFTVNIYRADGIICKAEKCGKEVEISCKNMFVKVDFAGKSAKTQVVGNSFSPSWNEGLNFIEAIPSLFQTISIQVWDKRKGILVGSTSLSLCKLWNETEASSLPTFGPFFKYLYQPRKKPSMVYFSGRILLSLHCTLLDRGNPAKLLKILSVPPCDEEKLPSYEQFTLFMAVFHCIFFKKKFLNNCMVTLHHGSIFVGPRESPIGDQICQKENSSIRFDKPARMCKTYLWWNGNVGLTSAQTTASWPSMQDRALHNNHVKYLMRKIVKLIAECRRAHHMGDSLNAETRTMRTLRLMHEACDEIITLPGCQFETNLDLTRKYAFLELLTKFKEKIDCNQRKNVVSPEEAMSMVENQVEEILQHIEDPQKTFPDFEIAVTKLSSKKKKSQILLKSEEYLFSVEEKEAGADCGKTKTLFLRDSSGADVAALDAFLWFGKRSEIDGCLQALPGVHNRQKDGDSPIQAVGVAKPHYFQLRVHIYQGRLNPGADASGLADPFVRVLAFGQCRETQVKAQTLDPFWDETLLFSQVTLSGDQNFIKTQSVGIIFEVLDYDGKDVFELVGRGVFRPNVKLLRDGYRAPRLTREVVYNCGDETGEVLLAMELIEIETKDEERPLKPASQYKIFCIPDEIRPHFQRYMMEVIFWGVRKAKNVCLPLAPRVLVLMECNGVRVESSLAKMQSTFNFEYCVEKSEIFIPQEEDYAPPLSISLYEFNCFNRALYKCGTTLPYVTRFLAEKSKDEKEGNPSVPNILDLHLWTIQQELSNHIVELDEKPDWWTKYYASKLPSRNIKKIKIYEDELEKQPEFRGFQDFLFKLDLMKGKTDLRLSLAKQELVANVKCAIKFHPCQNMQQEFTSMPGDFSTYPRSDPLDFTLRVYIIAAYNLTPTDINGRCDPYIALVMGKNTIIDRKNYTYKDTDPIIGKCYELKGTFPWDHTLRVRVMDHDICLSDNLIGQTFIDLENRYYTRHRASCGISDTFEKSGYCQWRDLIQPSEILEQVCKQAQIPGPQYSEEKLSVAGYSIHCKEGKEKVSLEMLRNFKNIPECGFPLVPEHVETRPLYHPKKPHIDQGKLEMWIDIFPGHNSLPPPVDITPRAPESLQLRVIVWNTADVLPSDTSLFTRERSSDIYVKAWLSSAKESQRTDIHYRSLTGEGNFNWRFIFSFIYSPAEQKMIIFKKVAFSEGPWKEKIPCTLELQVWDNDLISDDFIGSLSLNLWDMPRGAKQAKDCKLNMFEPNYPRTSLFKLKKARGWWPFSAKQSHKSKEIVIAGKVDMELEILTEDEAKSQPAGLGREGPSPLPEPNRPSTSFLWALNPLHLIKRMAFSGLGRKLLICSSILAVAVFVIAGWLAVPGLLLKKWLRA